MTKRFQAMMKDKEKVQDKLQAWETMRKILPRRKPTCFFSACVKFYRPSMTCDLCLGLRGPASKRSGHCNARKKTKVSSYFARSHPGHIALYWAKLSHGMEEETASLQI